MNKKFDFDSEGAFMCVKFFNNLINITHKHSKFILIFIINNPC